MMGVGSVNGQEERKAEWGLGWAMPAFNIPTPHMPLRNLLTG